MVTPDSDWDTYIAGQMINTAISSADKAKKDSEKDKRLESQLCRFCYYLRSNIGGCKITKKACDNCMKMVTYSSTVTNKLCLSCAKKADRCCRCNALISV